MMGNVIILMCFSSIIIMCMLLWCLIGIPLKVEKKTLKSGIIVLIIMLLGVVIFYGDFERNLWIKSTIRPQKELSVIHKTGKSLNLKLPENSVGYYETEKSHLFYSKSDIEECKEVFDSRKYKIIEPIKMKYIEGSIIGDFIDNKWEYGTANKVIGDRDTYFDRYDIYFEKGIKVKHLERLHEDKSLSIDGEISNVVFNSKFKDNILPNIKVTSTVEDIKGIFGEPHFVDDERDIIGYKGEQIYVFFSGKEEKREISVYRRDQQNLGHLVKNILDEYGDLKSNEEVLFPLTEKVTEKVDIKDYNYSFGFKYSSRYSRIGMGASSEGIKIYYNYSQRDRSTPFIFIAGNYQGIISEEIVEEFKLGEKPGGVIFEFQLDKDYVFDEEINRIDYKRKIETYSEDEEVAISPDGNIIAMRNRDDDVDFSLSGVAVIYLNGEKPNYEFRVPYCAAGGFTWISDRYFIYSVFRNGVYLHDMVEEKSECIIKNSTAGIIEASDGVMKYYYLKEAVDYEGEINYYFDYSGSIQFKGREN